MLCLKQLSVLRLGWRASHLVRKWWTVSLILSLSVRSVCLVCKILKADIDDDHQRDGKRTWVWAMCDLSADDGLGVWRNVALGCKTRKQWWETLWVNQGQEGTKVVWTFLIKFDALLSWKLFPAQNECQRDEYSWMVCIYTITLLPYITEIYFSDYCGNHFLFFRKGNLTTFLCFYKPGFILVKNVLPTTHLFPFSVSNITIKHFKIIYKSKNTLTQLVFWCHKCS